MPANRIIIRIEGKVTFNKSVAEVKALQDALRYTEQHISGDEKNIDTEYELVDLHHYRTRL